MNSQFKDKADSILDSTVSNSPHVPGVMAMITDRDHNVYEGSAGKRVIGQDAAMTTDTVMAIFSTTKAITGTAILQLVEQGKLDLDAPASRYAPDIGKLQVIEGSGNMAPTWIGVVRLSKASRDNAWARCSRTGYSNPWA